MFGALSLSRFRGRLLVIILAMSLLPIIGTGWAFFHVLNNTARTESFERLDLMRNAKRDELRQYLGFANWQAENLSRSNSVRYAAGLYYGFSYGFRLIDPSPSRSTEVLRAMFAVDSGDPVDDPPYPEMLRVAPEYANAHSQFHGEFADFIANSEFSNVYMVDTNQRVVYSVHKDAYLGLDLRSQMATSPLADAVRVVLASSEERATYVSDFAVDPVTGEFSALVASRIDFYRKSRGVAVYRLSTDKLDAIVQAQSRSSGQIYLLNQNNQVISAPTTALLQPGAVVAPQSSEDAAGVVSAGLGGEPALSARTGVAFQNLNWPLIAEIPTNVAFASSEFIRNLVIAVSLLVLPVLVASAFLLSGSMTRPLRMLTEEAGAIAEGDLDRVVPDIRSPSELARLSASFRRMRDAIREQLKLIGEKNQQLESQIALIAEKNQALEEADRMKDTFVANTSHELRTPLNGIMGIAETLSAGAAGALSSAQRNQLQLIVFSARRLSRLVDDLLDLYRIRENRIRLDIHGVHIPSSIKNVLRLADPLLRGSPVTLSVSLPEELPLIEADPLRFEQILYNLLANAVKYTQAGSIAITAGASGNVVHIVVSDTGRGIPGTDMERIFKPLERSSAEDEIGAPGGTGLGLTIARHLAQLMHGDLVAQSQLGSGSHFTLTLPASRSSRHEGDSDVALLERVVGQLNQPEIGQDTPTTDGVPLILVVDDEPINVQVLRNVLQPQGYAVRSAASGRQALDFIIHTRPDLVVLDVMMPGMDGLEVARTLRERYSLLDLPIMMVTARSRTRDVLAGFEAGANDYVTKPFVKDELLARVATLLEASQSLARGRENEDLRAEVERRTQVEYALRLSQQRMTRMLDTLEAAVLCVDAQRRVIYANQAARALLDAVGKADPLAELFGPTLAQRIVDAVRSDGRTQIDGVILKIDSRPVLVSAFELDPEAGGGLAVILGSAGPLLASSPDRFADTVRGVIDSVDIGHGEPPAPVTLPLAAPAADEYRQTIVEVMSASLALWRELTCTGKIDLAEQSGIWRVNLDRSSLQVRTLDKYLLVESLPQNPRWRDVVMTAEFVLDQTERHAPPERTLTNLATLQNALSRLRALLRNRASDGATGDDKSGQKVS